MTIVEITSLIIFIFVLIFMILTLYIFIPLLAFNIIEKLFDIKDKIQEHIYYKKQLEEVKNKILNKDLKSKK